MAYAGGRDNSMGTLLTRSFLFSETSEGHDYWFRYRELWDVDVIPPSEFNALQKIQVSMEKSHRVELYRNIISCGSYDPTLLIKAFKYQSRFKQPPSVELLNALS